MNDHPMVTNSMDVKVCDSVDEAPTYTEETPLLRIDQAVIVCQGTVTGAPTVDLIMSDHKGNKFVVMATGTILDMLAASVRGAHAKSTQEKGNG